MSLHLHSKCITLSAVDNIHNNLRPHLQHLKTLLFSYIKSNLNNRELEISANICNLCCGCCHNTWYAASLSSAEQLGGQLKELSRKHGRTVEQQYTTWHLLSVDFADGNMHWNYSRCLKKLWPCICQVGGFYSGNNWEHFATFSLLCLHLLLFCHVGGTHTS